MKKDLTGMTFGRLLVIGVSEVSRNGHYRYHVTCECGVNKTILGTHMLAGNTLSCGCMKRERRNWKGCGEVSMTYFSSLLRGAMGGKGRKPIPFELTIEFLSKILQEQDYKCALSGLSISVTNKTASLDRIDSSLGYLVDNVQWLHKDVNMMKRHYSEDYFKYLCQKIVDVGG